MMLSKKILLVLFYLNVVQSLCAGGPSETTQALGAVGQVPGIHKIDLKRVEQARVLSDRLIGTYRICRVLVGGAAVGSIGMLLYNFFKPLPSSTASMPVSAPVSNEVMHTQAATKLSGLSEEEFRKKVSERLTLLEESLAPLSSQEQTGWWRRLFLSYFDQVKVLSWAVLYYVLQTATSSVVIAAIDRVVPLAEIGASTPSLTWFIVNKTSFAYYLQDSFGRIKDGLDNDTDYALFCDSVSMFVHDIENIMGYLESYALLSNKDLEVKNFLQDMVKKLHSATDEFVDAVLRRDGRRALAGLTRIQRMVNNVKVICAG